MRPIDADRLLSDRMKGKYYHLPNGDTAVPIIDIENAPTIGGWTSVKERPPEEDKEVLAYNGAYRLIAAYTTNPTKYWYTITGSATLAITHWMPLPEPPKEDNNG